MVISVRQGMTLSREELMRRLVTLQYERNDLNFIRNKFRVRGDIVVFLGHLKSPLKTVPTLTCL